MSGCWITGYCFRAAHRLWAIRELFPTVSISFIVRLLLARNYVAAGSRGSDLAAAAQLFTSASRFLDQDYGVLRHVLRGNGVVVVRDRGAPAAQYRPRSRRARSALCSGRAHNTGGFDERICANSACCDPRLGRRGRRCPGRRHEEVDQGQGLGWVWGPQDEVGRAEARDARKTYDLGLPTLRPLLLQMAGPQPRRDHRFRSPTGCFTTPQGSNGSRRGTATRSS